MQPINSLRKKVCLLHNFTILRKSLLQKLIRINDWVQSENIFVCTIVA